MTLTITLRQHGKKPKSVSTPVSDLTLATLKQLWDIERMLNELPGADLRVHIEIGE